jgi:hypothetical protein
MAPTDPRLAPSSPTDRRSQPPAGEIAVLGLAALGFCLLPIGKRGKRPLIEKWPERATCDARGSSARMREES